MEFVLILTHSKNCDWSVKTDGMDLMVVFQVPFWKFQGCFLNSPSHSGILGVWGGKYDQIPPPLGH